VNVKGVVVLRGGMPPFQHHVFFCTNERSPGDPKGSCVQAGANELHAHAKTTCHAKGLRGAVRINKAGCLDTCAQGPAVVVYGSADPAAGVWYTLKTIADVDEVIEQHLVSGNVVERLRMKQRS
jgi:(2Fe-2S) ferredoxin